MEVTFNMTLADRQRWDNYVLTHRFLNAEGPEVICFISVFVIIGIASGITDTPWHLGVLTLCLPVAILYALSVKKRDRGSIPGLTPYVRTTTISADGVRDVSPNQDQLVIWKDVKAIRLHDGDLYFYKTFGEVMVPRDAFDDALAADRFYKTACQLWRRQAKTLQVSVIRDVGLVSSLEDGEEELWHGQSDPSVYAKGMLYVKTRMLAVLALVFTSVCASTPISALWLFPLFVWCVVFGFYVFEVFTYRDSAKRTLYRVTNKRIITSERKSGQPRLWLFESVPPVLFESVPLGQIEEIKYWERIKGVGDVEFQTASKSYAMLSSIPDVATVTRLVAQLREKETVNIDTLFASCRKSDPFLSVLHPGETILWQGQPERRPYIREFWGSWGGIVLYPNLLWIVLLSAMDLSLEQPLQQQIAEIAPFALLASWFVIRRFQKRVKYAATQFYAVTNQRLMFFDRSKPQFFAEADLAMLQQMKYKETGRGIGTISFGGEYQNDIEFEFLANPSTVREIIAKAKQGISGVSMEWKGDIGEWEKSFHPAISNRLGCGFLALMMLSPFIYLLFQAPVARMYSSYCINQYYVPGVRDYNRGDYSSAISELRAATDATDDEKAPYYLGLALMREGRNDAACLAFQRASLRAKYGETKDSEIAAKAQAMIAVIDDGRKPAELNQDRNERVKLSQQTTVGRL